MALAYDPKASESENVEPNMPLVIHMFFFNRVNYVSLLCRFKKSWHVYNNGNEPWPAGCCIQCAGGDNFGGSRILVPCLQPGEGAHLALDLKSPSEPGMYQSKWRLCTSGGAYFGGNSTVLFQNLCSEVNPATAYNQLKLPPLTLTFSTPYL